MVLTTSKEPPDKTHSIPYTFRKVWSIPVSIGAMKSELRPFITYAVKEMAKCNFWGSRFMNYHIRLRSSKTTK